MKITTLTGGALLLTFMSFASVQAQVSTDALVTGAYDGDTIYVEAEVWPRMTWTGSVRVLGADTPEIRGKCEQEKTLAILARDYVRELLADKTVRLTSVGEDKYGGRVLAKVFFWENETWNDLAGRLIEMQLARAYDGGARSGWCGDETIFDGLSASGTN